MTDTKTVGAVQWLPTVFCSAPYCPDISVKS